jgi:uncharacterized protein involved in type VI secretion and phage assembly
MNMNEQAIFDVHERLSHRFYGKYRGIVTDVDAPTLRIKAKVQQVLGNSPSGWCMPCVPYAGKKVGMAFLPEIGSGVWIEFEGGDVSLPIWAGCFWFEGAKPEEAKPHVKTIVTVAKHKILLDDDAGKIVISTNDGNTVTLDGAGITLERGSKVVISTGTVDINDGALEVA